MKSKCPDCYVMPGKKHLRGCDYETCANCGGQRLSCGCKTRKSIPWSGEHVLARDAKKNNLYCKLASRSGFSLIPCRKDNPEATLDLNRVSEELVWNKKKLCWEKAT